MNESNTDSNTDNEANAGELNGRKKRRRRGCLKIAIIFLVILIFLPVYCVQKFFRVDELLGRSQLISDPVTNAVIWAGDPTRAKNRIKVVD